MRFVNDDADHETIGAQAVDHASRESASSLERRTLRASLLRAATAAHV
ncbi:MAG: hypothetical protein ACR2KT_10525 [Methylocella sp.]